LKQFWEKWGKVIRRVWGEARLPLLIAIFWGVLTWYQGETIFKCMSAGAAAFVFVLFFQGQILRVAKNVRDEDNAKEMRDGFKSIQQALDELKKEQLLEATAGSETPAAATEPAKKRWRTTDSATVQSEIARAREVNDDLFRSRMYFAESQRAFEQKLFYSSILAAAVGFEHATRDAAELLDLDPRRPMTILVDDIGRRLEEPDLAKRLKTLIRLRNQFVHGQPYTTQIGARETAELLQGFRTGIDHLEYAMARIHPRAIGPS
jgi:uncharacterized protein YutE (UPF0331/DUF86 family)